MSTCLSDEIAMDQVLTARADAYNTQWTAALDNVFTEFTKSAPITDKGVHAVRRALKKARAGLRLFRESLDEEVYRKENVTLRDAGRRFSILRDSKSLLAAFDFLRNRYVSRLRQTRFDRVRKILRAKHKQTRNDFVRKPGLRKPSIELVESCRVEMEKLRVANGYPNAIKIGLQRLYRSGRKSFEDAQRKDTAEAIHEWRKQVKYLANALSIVAEAGKKKNGKYKNRLDNLTDKLGDDHDLIMFARKLASPSLQWIDAPLRVELISLANERRGKLKTRAFSLGKDLYDLKPKQWVKRYCDH